MAAQRKRRGFSGRHSLSPMQRRALPFVYLFILPTVVLFVMFYLQPIITVFVTGFASWNGYNAPEFTGLRNYERLFARANFLSAIWNLGMWSLIAAVIHVAIGLLMGFLFFHNYKGWKMVRGLYMVPNVISGAAWAMIYKFVFNNDYGVLNNMIRRLVPDFNVQWFYSSPAAFWAVTFTWLFYAVIVSLIVLADLLAIPRELHEAALIDGASSARITRHIDLPLCRISLGTSVILSVTSRIGMYEAIALTTRGGPGSDTMSLSVMLVNSITDMNYGMANAIGTIMFVVGIIVMLIIRKAFRMNQSVYG